MVVRKFALTFQGVHVFNYPTIQRVPRHAHIAQLLKVNCLVDYLLSCILGFKNAIIMQLALGNLLGPQTFARFVAAGGGHLLGQIL